MVEIVSYDPRWPQIFEEEAARIRKDLGLDVDAVHHIGSTSVPGLMAKPKIDIMAVVPNLKTLLEDPAPLEQIGYKARGELNIPFRLFFSKRNPTFKINLHVYENGNPDIQLHFLFRDALLNNQTLRNEYVQLKQCLFDQKDLLEKREQGFSGYTLGKDAFIKKVLDEAGFQGHTLRLCMHDDEWQAAQALREAHGLAEKIACVQSETSIHVVFYRGTHIIGYAHIAFLPHQKAFFHIVAMDKIQSKPGDETAFRTLCQKWLEQKGWRVME